MEDFPSMQHEWFILLRSLTIQPAGAESALQRVSRVSLEDPLLVAVHATIYDFTTIGGKGRSRGSDQLWQEPGYGEALRVVGWDLQHVSEAQWVESGYVRQPSFTCSMYMRIFSVSMHRWRPTGLRVLCLLGNLHVRWRADPCLSTCFERLSLAANGLLTPSQRITLHYRQAGKLANIS